MRRLAASGLVVLVAIFGAQGTAFAARTAAGSARPEHYLLGVSCTSAKFCMAVGADWRNGRPLTEKWNGVKWTAADLRLPGGAAAGTLYWVWCGRPDSCIAVGNTASNRASSATTNALAESWNGRSWSAFRMPVPAGTHNTDLGGIDCVSTRNCVVTGLAVLPGSHYNSFIDVLKGGRWTLYRPPGFTDSKRNSILENVSCAAANRCVAVGSYGNTNSPGGAAPANVAAAVTWNGRKWSLDRLPTPAGSKGAWVLDVSCVRSKACVAVGGRSVGGKKSTALAEILKAGKWKAVTPSAEGSDPSLYAVSCVSATRCLAGGGGDFSSTINTNKSVRNKAFSSYWNGRTWKYARLPTPPKGGGSNASVVSAISCLTATKCVAVGAAGPPASLIYGFSAFWNGRNWRLVSVS
ncbi:MAG TPA: hypothetical protein VMA95_05595 [Streptosporangiaceae bacterium]|nr:hypothetical protein [Streptosporangiaceae bacterium]